MSDEARIQAERRAFQRPAAPSGPLRPGNRATELWLGVGVNAALVVFNFAGFFSGKLSEAGSLALWTTIVVFTGTLVAFRTTLKGAAVVKGPGRAPVVPGAPKE